jgi:hypothetical protein
LRCEEETMITERMQRHLLYQCFVANKLDSAEIDIHDWTEPWREVFLLAERNDTPYIGVEPLWYALETVAKDREIARLWRTQIDDAAGPLAFPSLAEIADTLTPVRWVWPNWVPRGMLSILGAYQGTGKSFLVLDLARTVIDGGPWPDGAPCTQLGAVLYVEAESVPQLTNERALALGLNRHKLWLLMPDNGQISGFDADHLAGTAAGHGHHRSARTHYHRQPHQHQQHGTEQRRGHQPPADVPRGCCTRTRLRAAGAAPPAQTRRRSV